MKSDSWCGRAALILVLVLSFSQAIYSLHDCQPPNSSYVKIDYVEPQGMGKSGTLNAFVYYIDRDATPAKATGVAGALLLVVDGEYAAGGEYCPFGGAVAGASACPSNVKGLNKVCKMITDENGYASAQIPHPEYKAVCVSHRAVFCPYTKNDYNEPEKNLQTNRYLATCAGLVDANNELIDAVAWQDIPFCPNADSSNEPAQVKITCEYGVETLSDLRRVAAPSQAITKVCGEGENPQQVMICWIAAMVGGLLFAASFMSGKNPLAGFDFGVTRGIGRSSSGSGGGPPPSNQQSFTPNVSAIASVADKVVNNISSLSKGKGWDMDQGFVSSKIYGGTEKKNVVDEKGNVTTKKVQTEGVLDKMTGGLTNALGLRTGKNVALDKSIDGMVKGAITGGAMGMVNLVAGAVSGRGLNMKKASNAAASVAFPSMLRSAMHATNAAISMGIKELGDADLSEAHKKGETTKPQVNLEDAAKAALLAICNKEGWGEKGKLTIDKDGNVLSDGKKTGVRYEQGGSGYALIKDGQKIGEIGSDDKGGIIAGYTTPNKGVAGWVFSLLEPSGRTYGLNFDISKDGKVNDITFTNYNMPSVRDGSGQEQGFNMGLFMQTKQAQASGGQDTRTLAGWLGSIGSSLLRGFVNMFKGDFSDFANVLKLLTFSDMTSNSIASYIPLSGLFSTFRAGNEYTIQNPRKQLELEDEFGNKMNLVLLNGQILRLKEGQKKEEEKITIIGSPAWMVQQKKKMEKKEGANEGQKEQADGKKTQEVVGTYDNIKVGPSTALTLTFTKDVGMINASKDNPRIYRLGGDREELNGKLVDITDTVLGKEVFWQNLDNITKTEQKNEYLGEYDKKMQAPGYDDLKARVSLLSSGNYEVKLSDGQRYILDVSQEALDATKGKGQLYEVNENGEKGAKVKNNEVSCTGTYRYFASDYISSVNRQIEEKGKNGEKSPYEFSKPYQVENTVNGPYYIVPEANGGTYILKDTPRGFEGNLFQKSNIIEGDRAEKEMIIVKENRSKQITFENVEKLGLEKPKEGKINIGGYEWTVSGRDDNGNWKLSANVDGKELVYYAHQKENGEVGIRKEEKGKDVDGIKIKGTTYRSIIPLPDESLAVNNLKGSTVGIKVKEGVWEADFYNSSGQKLTYSGYGINEKGEAVIVQKPVKTVGDLMDATLFARLDADIDRMLMTGYGNGIFRGLEKNIGLKGYDSLGDNFDNITNGIFNYLTWGMGGKYLEDVASTRDREYAAQTRRLEDEMEEALEESGFGEFAGEALEERREETQKEIGKEARKAGYEFDLQDLSKLKMDVLEDIYNKQQEEKNKEKYDALDKDNIYPGVKYSQLTGREEAASAPPSGQEEQAVGAEGGRGAQKEYVSSQQEAPKFDESMAYDYEKNLRLMYEYAPDTLSEEIQQKVELVNLINESQMLNSKAGAMEYYTQEKLAQIQKGVPTNIVPTGIDKKNEFHPFAIEQRQIKGIEDGIDAYENAELDKGGIKALKELVAMQKYAAAETIAKTRESIYNSEARIHEIEAMALTDSQSARALAKAQLEILSQSSQCVGEIRKECERIEEILNANKPSPQDFVDLKEGIGTIKEMREKIVEHENKMGLYNIANDAMAAAITIGVADKQIRRDMEDKILEIAQNPTSYAEEGYDAQSLLIQINTELRQIPAMPASTNEYLFGADSSVQGIKQKIKEYYGVDSHIKFEPQVIENISRKIENGEDNFRIKDRGGNEYFVKKASESGGKSEDKTKEKEWEIAPGEEEKEKQGKKEKAGAYKIEIHGSKEPLDIKWEERMEDIYKKVPKAKIVKNEGA